MTPASRPVTLVEAWGTVVMVGIGGGAVVLGIFAGWPFLVSGACLFVASLAHLSARNIVRWSNG